MTCEATMLAEAMHQAAESVGRVRACFLLLADTRELGRAAAALSVLDTLPNESDYAALKGAMGDLWEDLSDETRGALSEAMADGWAQAMADALRAVADEEAEEVRKSRADRDFEPLAYEVIDAAARERWRVERAVKRYARPAAAESLLGEELAQVARAAADRLEDGAQETEA
jgi:hypothetical protein